MTNVICFMPCSTDLVIRPGKVRTALHSRRVSYFLVPLKGDSSQVYIRTEYFRLKGFAVSSYFSSFVTRCGVRNHKGLYRFIFTIYMVHNYPLQCIWFAVILRFRKYMRKCCKSHLCWSSNIKKLSVTSSVVAGDDVVAHSLLLLRFAHFMTQPTGCRLRFSFPKKTTPNFT